MRAPAGAGEKSANTVLLHDVAEILGCDGVARLGGEDSGVGDDDVETAQFGHALSTASRSPSTSRVDDGGKDLLTGGLDELDGLGEVVGSRGIVGNARRKFARDVDGDDVGALVGHPDCVRATLTPCGPGDEGHLARQPSAHFWAALTRFDPMISRWISLVPSYNRSSRTSR